MKRTIKDYKRIAMILGEGLRTRHTLTPMYRKELTNAIAYAERRIVQIKSAKTLLRN